jgi:hypothetical protein
VFALKLAVRLLLGLGLFQRDDLRLGQHQTFMGAFGFQRLEPLALLARSIGRMKSIGAVSSYENSVGLRATYCPCVARWATGAYRSFGSRGRSDLRFVFEGFP